MAVVDNESKEKSWNSVNEEKKLEFPSREDELSKIWEFTSVFSPSGNEALEVLRSDDFLPPMRSLGCILGLTQ